ncbi:type IV toxin-antitoxin system AbiEi family antitoxin domain-containing protein [Nocardioides solisilvae]|uniref:type IV toxin-antitoxin system AbiEi family antitoxin domain-containing protein n=1 Tax=Nocardioides solisilvae TaxID=1542435 RepID=UPI000D744293|nr:type IV toxin-antitoxin system AbiEi family antitoxin domain-containing protein [Nocardioides solisilvae]
MDENLARLLAQQSGVVSRRQALEAGLGDHDLRRMLRRRELSRIHPGVLVDHTGEPTWRQRAWAGVLHAWPAALCDSSALLASENAGGPAGSVIHVAVDRERRVVAPAGTRLHRVTGLHEMTLWNASPPRLRTEPAVLRTAARARDDFEAVQVLANAVQSRRTTAARLLHVLGTMERLPRRDFLARVLADVAAGACSVLEHVYLARVERAHGLLRGERQVHGSSRGPVLRDVLYRRYRQVVEIDGRLFHDTAAARHADLDRDLDAALDGLHTVRLGWGQVVGTPCRTADRVGTLLQRRGWDGHVRRCPSCPS